MSIVHGDMSFDQSSFKLLWWRHQLLSGFLAKDHLHQVPRQSLLSANNKGNNEMILGAVHKYPGIYLKSEEKPAKFQL